MRLGILLMIITTIFMSFGQIYWKLGADSSNLLNLALLIGFALNGLAALVNVFAYKHGEFSALYPFLALNFVWVSILSVMMLGEAMEPFKWLGVTFIIVGVIFTGSSEVDVCEV